MLRDQTAADSYAAWVEISEPGLARALIAGFGSEVGREAAAEALVYGWQHWDRLEGMENPAGYLFRVGQSAARRMAKSDRRSFRRSEVVFEEPWAEPGFGPAWSSLTERQRIVTGLVHGFGWSLREVADLLGLSKAAVQTHERRAMRKLRRDLGVEE